MKIGIETAAVRYIAQPAERYARIRALGYDTADENIIQGDQPWYRDAAMEDYCRTLREAAAASGVEIFQVHGPWPTDDTTPESRKRVWADMHQSVYGCHLMGAPYLVIHPQMPYGWGEEQDSGFAYQLTYDLLKDLLPDCERYGVTLCLENMPMTAHRISPTQRIAEVVRAVGSDLVGICLDTGHSNVFGHDLGEEVRVSAPYLRTLHVHDNNGTSDQHLLPWLGSADWDHFVQALAEVGYDGSISMETAGAVSLRMPPALRQIGEEQTVKIARYLAGAVDAARQA